MAKKTKKKTAKAAARKAKPAARKSTAKRSTARKSIAPAMASPKQQYLDVLGREHQTTLRVMRAFPSGQGGFQPHERSSSAKRLMWTFAIEQNIALNAIKGTLKMPPSFPPEPDTVEEAIAAFETAVKEVIATLEKAPDSRVFGTAPFFAGPGKIADYRILDLIWMMLLDQIHHRGQLSVYNRMAGGKVPSIYGPSADEPWM
ncbi:MAG: DinB family protein [Vicinamibacterales bacterium]